MTIVDISAILNLTNGFIKNPDFAIEYMARTSKARFKIGRRQMSGNLFDLVISDPAGKNISQLESFTAIKSYLTKIQ